MGDRLDDRKSALVAAAHKAVAQHGLEGLRLRTVAAEVGIDHSTLHHHFATKQDLIEAVVAHATAPLRSTLPFDGNPTVRLRSHLERLAELITTDPDRFVVLAEMDLRARRDPQVAATIEAVESGWRGVLDDLGLTPGQVELLIAAVKGVRLFPTHAREVLVQVTKVLTSQLARP